MFLIYIIFFQKLGCSQISSPQKLSKMHLNYVNKEVNLDSVIANNFDHNISIDINSHKKLNYNKSESSDFSNFYKGNTEKTKDDTPHKKYLKMSTKATDDDNSLVSQDSKNKSFSTFSTDNKSCNLIQDSPKTNIKNRTCYKETNLDSWIKTTTLKRKNSICLSTNSYNLNSIKNKKKEESDPSHVPKEKKSQYFANTSKNSKCYLNKQHSSYSTSSKTCLQDYSGISKRSFTDSNSIFKQSSANVSVLVSLSPCIWYNFILGQSLYIYICG